MKERTEIPVQSTLFADICRLAELGDEPNLTNLLAGGSVNIIEGNYLPVGWLAMQGNQEAVQFLIEKFNGDKQHAALIAGQTNQLNLIDFLLKQESDSEQYNDLYNYIIRGVARAYIFDEKKLDPLFLSMSAHPSVHVRKIPQTFANESVKILAPMEPYIFGVSKHLKINYFLAETLAKKMDWTNELDLKRLVKLRFYIDVHHLNYAQAEALVYSTAGAQMWLLQALRQLTTGSYIDIDNNFKSTENKLPLLPIELWLYITKIIFGLNENADINKILIAENRSISDCVVLKYQNSSIVTNIPDFALETLSFFRISAPKDKKTQLDNEIQKEEERYLKRISF